MCPLRKRHTMSWKQIEEDALKKAYSGETNAIFLVNAHPGT